MTLKAAPAVHAAARDAATKSPVQDVKVECAFCSSSIPVLVFKREARWAGGSGALSPGAYPCKLTVMAGGRVPSQVGLKEPPLGGRLELMLEAGADGYLDWERSGLRAEDGSFAFDDLAPVSTAFRSTRPSSSCPRRTSTWSWLRDGKPR